MKKIKRYLFLSGILLAFVSCVDRVISPEGYDSFKAGKKPVITLDSVTDITNTSAVIVATLVDNGGRKIDKIRVGLAETQPPLYADTLWTTYPSEIREPGDTLHIPLSGLDFLTSYSCRLYVSHRDSGSYSQPVIFRTTRNPLLQNPVTLQAEVRPYSMVYVYWKLDQEAQQPNTDITDLGVVYALHNQPTTEDIKNSIVPMWDTLVHCDYFYEFEPGATYYYRAFARNSHGTAYGKVKSFTTAVPTVPRLYDLQLEQLEDKTAVFSFRIEHTGGSDITAYGIRGNTQNTPDGNIDYVKESYTWTPRQVAIGLRMTATDLKPNTTYYVCGYVKTDAATCFTDKIAFTTPPQGTQVPDTWIPVSTHPALGPDDQTVLCTAGEDLYTLFSFNQNTSCYQNEFWKFDFRKNEWQRLPDFPGKSRQECLCVSTENCIYVGAGYQTQNGIYDYLYDFWKYDLLSATWTRLNNCPGKLYQSGAGFQLQGKIYAGASDFQWVANNLFWRYDPDTDRWSRIADLPGPPISEMVAFTVGERAFMACGIYYFFHVMTDLWEYLPDRNEWVQLTTYPGLPVYQPLAFTQEDRIYIGGGIYCYDVNFRMDSRQLWAYDLTTGHWERKRNIPVNGKAENAATLKKGYFLEKGKLYRYMPENETLLSKPCLP